MYARTSKWRGPTEALERWADHVGEKVAPMVASIPGNAGAYFFINRETGLALTLTLWDSEEAAAASDEMAEKSRESTIATTGVELLERARFEVVRTP
jgi:heme-degrading monooxygenase HmoA